MVESLRRQLPGADRYVVTREERAAAYDRMGIPPAGILSHASVFKIAELTDADMAILGSFEVQGDQLSIEARVLEMRGPRLSQSLRESGPLKDLLEIQGRLAAAILRAEDQPGTSEIEPLRVRLDAWEYYVRGLVAAERAQQVKFLLEAARLEPAFPGPAFELGKIYSQNRDYQTAVPWLLKLSKDDPNYLEATFLLGLAYFQLEQFDKSEAAFRSVAEQLPLNEAYNNLGAAESRLGKKAALENFRKALEGDPADPDYNFNLGYWHWKTGEYAQAVRRFRDTLARQPGDTEARLLLVQSLERMGLAAEAEREREGAARPAAEPARSTRRPAVDRRKLEPLERLKRNYEGASYRQLSLALEKGGEEKLLSLPVAEQVARHLDRGRQLYVERKDSEALEEFRELVRLEPENAEGYLYLMRLHVRAGHSEEARTAALRAAELSKKEAEPCLVLARIYQSQGKRAEALDALDRALQREPGNREARSLRESIQQSQGPAPR